MSLAWRHGVGMNPFGSFDPKTGRSIGPVQTGDAGEAEVAFWHSLRQRYPWLVPGGLLLILAFLTVRVLAGGPLGSADSWIREVVQAQASSATWRWLGGPARLVVSLAGPDVAVPILALIAVVVCFRRRTLRPVLTAAVGVALLLVTVIPAKILIGRPSPGYASVAPGSMGAFPSGHTTTACVCYGVAVLLLVRGRSDRIRRFALAGLAVACFLVGAALVWCDYHWFTDVVAGWALAAILVPLTFRLTGENSARSQSQR